MPDAIGATSAFSWQSLRYYSASAERADSCRRPRPFWVEPAVTDSAPEGDHQA